MAEKIRIGILISGGGTNMQAIVRACQEGRVNANVVFVGADNLEAKGLAWAKLENIPTFVVEFKKFRKNFPGFFDDCFDDDLVKIIHSRSTFIHSRFRGDEKKQLEHISWKMQAEREIIKKSKEAEIDLLVLAGFMQVCTSYLIDNVNKGDKSPRIMNIHPALLPAFPGTDGYGDTVRYGCKVGGCTVHFVDYGEDSGPIIGQRAIPIFPEDDIDSFRKKGLQQEYELYPECIQLFAEGKLRVVRSKSGRRVVLITEPYS